VAGNSQAGRSPSMQGSTSESANVGPATLIEAIDSQLKLADPGTLTTVVANSQTRQDHNVVMRYEDGRRGVHGDI
jgi:hypothetical protein